MLDPEIARLMGSPEPLPELTPALVPALRANMAAMAATLPAMPLAEVRDMDANGVPVRLYRSSAEDGLPLLVFVHGGGWFLGDLQTHDAMHRKLAALTGCAVLAVGYRLAPEHPFPSGLDDVATAFAWARRSAAVLGCDPERIALGGESAGANLTAALTLRLRELGEPQPSFQLLIHPPTDLTFSYPSIDEVELPGMSRAYLEACGALYAGTTVVSDPLVSPYLASSQRDLAPAIVVTVSEDPLRDDGERYAQALIAAGVETTALRIEGLPHGFMFLPTTLSAVGEGFRLIARLVRRYFEWGHDGS